MKKQVAAVVVLAMVALLSVAGCTSSMSPSPTATPSAASPPALTQDQLNTAENTMISSGYTVTQHLIANGTGADGSLYYTGQLAKNGSTYDYHIIVCNDPATADAHFSSSVSFTQQLGFSGSYSNDGSAWIGTMLYNGVPIGAGVTELTNSAPYMVIEFFGAQSSSPPSIVPTAAPTPTPTPSGHNAVLEQTVSNQHDLVYYPDPNYTTTAWNVIWNNDNSVTITSTLINNQNKSAVVSNETLLMFPTTQDATNYLNTLDLSKYTSENMNYIRPTPFIYAISNQPMSQTVQYWLYLESSNPLKSYEIYRYDNLIQFVAISVQV